MTSACRLLVAENVERPNSSRTGRALSGKYEPEHSERQVSGSVAVPGDGRWRAVLAVPLGGDQSALLAIERVGPLPSGAPAVEAVTLVVPPGEADAVVALMTGVVAQARREGVL
jgi:hypothetical protein